MARSDGRARDATQADRAWPVYRRLLGYTRRYWPIMALAVAGMAIDAASTAGFAALLEPILDEAFLANNEAMIARLPPWLVLLFVVRGVGGFAAEYGMASVGRGIVRDLRDQVFDRYLVLPAEFYDRQTPGQLIARLTYHVEQVAEAGTKAITTVVRDLLYVVFLLAVMFLQSVPLTLATLLIGPAIALLVFYVSRRFRRLSRRIQESMGDVSHRTAEIVSAHREVKIYGGRDDERAAFARLNQDNRRQHLKLVATKSASTSLVQLVAGIALAGIFFLATRDTMLREMSPGSFIAFMTAMLGILPSLKRLTDVHAIIQRGVAAAESIFEIVDAAAEPETGRVPIDRARGVVEFRDVSLRYAGTCTQVLEGISFRAEPGTLTAIVGRSGSGKTSLVSLIARLYAPSSGEILLDGDPIGSYALRDYRRQLAWVGQDVILFADTIERNIAYGTLRGASRETILAAARDANALEFIERLPDGLDTRIGEGGLQLSGGQRQRIAIARAILRDAPILILDEATSALDTESERLIQQALEHVMRRRTTFVIAHRLSTVERADQVIVLEGGRLVEQGRHDELVARDGPYALLRRLQFTDGDGAG